MSDKLEATVQVRKRGMWAIKLARVIVHVVYFLGMPERWAVGAVRWAVDVARVEYRLRMNGGVTTEWTTKRMSEVVDVDAITPE